MKILVLEFSAIEHIDVASYGTGCCMWQQWHQRNVQLLPLVQHNIAKDRERSSFFLTLDRPVCLDGRSGRFTDRSDFGIIHR